LVVVVVFIVAAVGILALLSALASRLACTFASKSFLIFSFKRSRVSLSATPTRVLDRALGTDNLARALFVRARAVVGFAIPTKPKLLVLVRVEGKGKLERVFGTGCSPPPNGVRRPVPVTVPAIIVVVVVVVVVVVAVVAVVGVRFPCSTDVSAEDTEGGKDPEGRRERVEREEERRACASIRAESAGGGAEPDERPRRRREVGENDTLGIDAIEEVGIIGAMEVEVEVEE